MEKIENKRKINGAFVWHKGELKRITNQNVGKEYCVIENRYKLKKKSIILAKIGDSVEFKNLSILPERCSKMKNMKITYFYENGIVGTDSDLYPDFDGSGYGHFVKPKTTNKYESNN